MNIGKNHRLQTDTNNIILQEQQTRKKSGAKFWANIGYFSTVENAMNYLVDHRIRGAGLADFQRVAEEVKALRKEIAAWSKGASLISERQRTSKES